MVQSPAVGSPSYLYSEVLPRSQRVQPSPAPSVQAAASADHPDAQVSVTVKPVGPKLRLL